MKVTELNREQLIQLKRMMLPPNAGYGDLARADALIPDYRVFEDYAGVEFVEEDFV